MPNFGGIVRTMFAPPRAPPPPPLPALYRRRETELPGRLETTTLGAREAERGGVGAAGVTYGSSSISPATISLLLPKFSRDSSAPLVPLVSRPYSSQSLVSFRRRPPECPCPRPVQRSLARSTMTAALAVAVAVAAVGDSGR